MGEGLNRRIEMHACRQHHLMLRHILGEFSREALSPRVTIVLIGRLKSILIRHLKLEDGYVYPALSQADDERVRSTAIRLQMEMGGLMRDFEAFEKRWPDAEALERDPAGFSDDWQPLRRALELRMKAEDETLYLHAEEHFKAAQTDS